MGPTLVRSPSDTFLTSAQLISIFGASITFTLIVGSNAAPKRFTDQTVRDLLSLSWLSFSAALIMASFGQWVAVAREKNSGERWDPLTKMSNCQKFIYKYGIFFIGNLLLAPCFLLAVVALAYSDVGWVAISFFAITAPVASAAFFVYGTSDPPTTGEQLESPISPSGSPPHICLRPQVERRLAGRKGSLDDVELGERQCYPRTCRLHVRPRPTCRYEPEYPPRAKAN